LAMVHQKLLFHFFRVFGRMPLILLFQPIKHINDLIVCKSKGK